MDLQKLLLSYDGRISRQPYWIGTLVLLGAGVVAGFIPLVNLLFPLASIYVWVCLYNKRLHDLGRSGWWQLIVWVGCIGAMIAGAALMIPSLIALLGGAHSDEAAVAAVFGSGGALLLIVLACLGGVVFHIVVGVLAGQAGANAYGPDPLSPSEAEAFQ